MTVKTPRVSVVMEKPDGTRFVTAWFREASSKQWFDHFKDQWGCKPLYLVRAIPHRRWKTTSRVN